VPNRLSGVCIWGWGGIKRRRGKAVAKVPFRTELLRSRCERDEGTLDFVVIKWLNYSWQPSLM
jgi:hypothetical protein